MSLKIYDIDCAASVNEESMTDVGGFPIYSNNEGEIIPEDLIKLKDDINQTYGNLKTMVEIIILP